MARRARTKHLIELGGLVAKAGLVELTVGDRALLYGAFLDIAERLRTLDGDVMIARWKQRGARAFADDSEQCEAGRAAMQEDGTGAG